MKIVSVGDLHPGRWLKGEEETTRALHAIAEHAIDAKADRFIVNGDYSEELLLSRGEIDPAVYRRQCEIIGRVFGLISKETDLEIEVVNGNHDDLRKLTKEGLQRLFSGDGRRDIRFAPQETVMRPHPDVVITHGHILMQRQEIRERIERALAEGRDATDLINDLNESEAAHENHVEKNPGIWHYVGMVQRRLKRIPNYEQVTESAAIPFVRGMRKHLEQKVHELFGKAPVVRRRNHRKARMTDTAAHLAAALDSPLAVVGHDHLYGIAPRTIFDERTGGWKTAHVVNSGDFIGKGRFKGASIVDTDEKQADLLRYLPEKDVLVRDENVRYGA